jgi:hypothetical protein
MPLALMAALFSSPVSRSQARKGSNAVAAGLVNPAQLRLKTAMSKGKEMGREKGRQTSPQEARLQRSAEALRRNLQRRKLQARGRAAAAGEPAAVEARVPRDAKKQCQ